MSIHRLEDDLRALRDDVAWPPAPDVAATLPARLGGPGRGGAATLRRPAARRRARLAVAVALLAVAVAGAVPPARSAVLELLGVEGGERIRRVDEPPVAPPRERPSDAPGRRVSPAEARSAVDVPLRPPRALGPPDELRVWDGVPGGAVILLYGRDTALWSFRGSATAYVEKLAGPETVVRRVRVGGARGVWLTGAPFGFLVATPSGRVVEGTSAVVDANVLAWRRGPVAYRLETRLGLAAALRVASSVGRRLR